MLIQINTIIEARLWHRIQLAFSIFIPDSSKGKHPIIFGPDMSLSRHIDNKGKGFW